MIDSFLLRCLGLDDRYRNFGGVEVMIDSFLLRCSSWYRSFAIKIRVSHLHMFAHKNSNPFVAKHQRKKTM